MTLSSISSSVPPIGYGDPLQFTANELKNTLDTKAWEFHQQALSKRTKFANSKFGTLLSRPAHTQKQLTQLASMYEDLSHALDITIQQDKRTEIPKAWRAGDIHNRLWGFHDDRRKYMYEVPSCKGSRDTDNDLKEVDHRFVEVCSEALAYLAAPQQNGIAPSVCSTKASEWGQIGATRECRFFSVMSHADGVSGGYDTMFGALARITESVAY